MASLITYEPTARFSELMESELAASAADQQEKANADGMSEQRILVGQLAMA